MRRIDWTAPFRGADGKKRTGSEIEIWFANIILHPQTQPWSPKIRVKRRLKNIPAKYEGNTSVKDYIDKLTKELPDLLKAQPIELQRYALEHHRWMLKEFATEEDRKIFNDLLLNAFGYKTFRAHLLPSLAMRLNIRTCPYCDQHYTLFVTQETDEGVKKEIAKFQFDHFFNKSKFPILSMSLYNLVPSCAACNMSKSSGDFSLDYHPYQADTGEKLAFVLADGWQSRIYKGMEDTEDELKVVVEACGSASPDAVGQYAKALNLTAVYSRHPDIIEQIGDALYLESYYRADNLPFLEEREARSLYHELRDRVMRQLLPEEEDVGRHPMTKFRIDIRRFLEREMGTTFREFESSYKALAHSE